MKKIAIAVCLLFTIALMGACSNDQKSSSNESNKSEEVKVKGKIQAEDFEKLYSDPIKYKGYEVELTGSIFNEPEKDDDGTYIQLWADPENSEKNTLAAIMDPNLEVKTGDYVKIKGVVQDEFEGENAFGGIIKAPMILADSIEVVDYITAVSPTIKEVKVGKEINQHDLVFELQKIEIADKQTRVYLKVKNNTTDKASFYSSSAKLIVGNAQLENEYVDSETTGLKEIQSEILPGIEAEGVIVYPAIDPNVKELKLHVEAHNENYDLDFSPYIFDVSVQ
jgi:hypothetical protein